MFCMLKRKKIYPAYDSNHNWNREKQVILSMISNGKKKVLSCCKKLTTLLKGTASKKQGWFLLFELSSLV